MQASPSSPCRTKRNEDGRPYAATPGASFESLIVMMRAHEEIATKSMRVASAYERKRERAANGDKSKPFTRTLPAWLR
jgi:hypothetical protein